MAEIGLFLVVLIREISKDNFLTFGKILLLFWVYLVKIGPGTSKRTIKLVFSKNC